MTLANVFISSCVGGAIMLLMLDRGVSNAVVLPVSILASVMVYTWIILNHKLRHQLTYKEQDYE
jgi:hypothetical protein